MSSDAYFSECRRYRYWLVRVWDDALPLFCTIGVNPSTADETADDATIRKDIGFARRLGFGGVLKLNVGAFRSTDPVKWRRASDPIGPENTVDHLKGYLEKFKPGKVVATWGRNGRYAPERCAAIVREIPDLECFGRNDDGTPRHTLMLPYTTQLERWARSMDTSQDFPKVAPKT